MWRYPTTIPARLRMLSEHLLHFRVLRAAFASGIGEDVLAGRAVDRVAQVLDERRRNGEDQGLLPLHGIVAVRAAHVEQSLFEVEILLADRE